MVVNTVRFLLRLAATSQKRRLTRDFSWPRIDNPLNFTYTYSHLNHVLGRFLTIDGIPVDV